MNDESAIVFTAQDQRDLTKLEAKVSKGLVDTFTALREIRERKLFYLILNEDGSKRYKSFGEYVEDKFQKPRQWVTRGTNWLKVNETLNALGMTEKLSVGAAQVFPQEDGSAEAEAQIAGVLKEVHGDGLPFTEKNLRTCIERWRDFYNEPAVPVNKPKALTYEAYKADRLVVEPLGELSIGDVSIVPSAERMPGDLSANVVNVATEQQKLPFLRRLLGTFTGPELVKVVDRLKPIIAKREELKKLNAALEAKKKEREEKEKSAGVDKLDEEINKLEAKQKELLPTKKKPEPKQTEEEKKKQKEEADKREALRKSIIGWEVSVLDEDEIKKLGSTTDNLPDTAQGIAEEHADSEVQWEEDDEDFTLRGNDGIYEVRPLFPQPKVKDEPQPAPQPADTNSPEWFKWLAATMQKAGLPAYTGEEWLEMTKNAKQQTVFHAFMIEGRTYEVKEGERLLLVLEHPKSVKPMPAPSTN